MQAMKTVTLDAHTEWSQMAVISPDGEILIELQVETTPSERLSAPLVRNAG